MSTTVPFYQKPIEFGIEPENLVQYWDRANKAYNNQDYRGGLFNTIKYINSHAFARKDTKGDINAVYNHGSASVNIKVNDTDFEISAPFLKIHNANKIALMRRVVEANFSSLTLAQIALKNDALTFYFKTSLDLCHPLKIFDVIREICIYADDFDDEFIEKYKAEYYRQPDIRPLSEPQKEKAWQSFQAIASQCDEYVAAFEQKRWMGSMWYVMAISMLNLSNMAYIHGTLRTDLEKAIATHYNGDLDGSYRIDQSKAFLRKLFHETSKEKFMENVYLADKFVSIKSRSSVEILMALFDNEKDDFIKDLNEGNNFSAAYSMQCFFIKLMYEYNLDGKHEDVILKTLERIGGKECGQAAKILWNTYSGFLNGAVEGGPRRKGLLARLFN